MRWTVLSDNRTHDDTLETEHGLSILLETNGHRIVLDTGASDLFLRNAERLGLDLSTADYVFISHGHSDHAGGLQALAAINTRARVIVSPHAIAGTFFSKRRYLHSITATWPELPKERWLMADGNMEIDERLSVIAHIPQQQPMPKGNQHLFTTDAQGACTPDDFRHELAFYADGLLFTGCAHNGLENILNACPWPIHTVVGGFHLLDGQETEEELETLARKLTSNYPNTRFFTSHCTGDAVFDTLKKTMGNQLQHFFCGYTQT